jgi:nitroreductase
MGQQDRSNRKSLQEKKTMSKLKKPAHTSVPVHQLITHRWSPRIFEDRAVEPEKLRGLFEAARWAASSYNAQPWSFIVGTKDDPANYQLVLDCFIEFNQGWAKSAPVLALSVAQMKFGHNDQPNSHAFHDVGQAAATLQIQAEELGLAVHQMAGIIPDKAREIFKIPAGFDVVAGFAIGYAGDPANLPEQLRAQEVAPRERKALDSFVFTGEWGKPSPLVAKK